MAVKKMLKKNDEVILKIEDISVNGQGIGKSDGQVIFCKNLVPGDEAVVKIIKQAKRFYIAIPIEILKKSPHRAESKCPYFKKCGGCSIQNLTYDYQLEYKSKKVVDAFTRLGAVDVKIMPCVASENDYNYRNKSVIPVSRDGNTVVAGFYSPGTHNIVDISSCDIQNPALNDVFTVVKKWLNKHDISTYNELTGFGLVRHIFLRISKTGDLMVGLIATEEKVPHVHALIEQLKSFDGFKNFSVNINDKKTNVILGDKTISMYGEKYITHKIFDLEFGVSLQSFLQVNTAQCENLYVKVLEYADIKATDIVVDLYSGIGTLSLLAAQKAQGVIGIEYARSAVDNATRNAKINSIKNTQFICGDCSVEYKKLQKEIDTIDILIVDPPRKGLDSALIETILKDTPQKIVYVSCDPSTLARDLKLLKDKYDIIEATPFDMFPQTTHVETVTMIQRKDT